MSSSFREVSSAINSYHGLNRQLMSGVRESFLGTMGAAKLRGGQAGIAICGTCCGQKGYNYRGTCVYFCLPSSVIMYPVICLIRFPFIDPIDVIYLGTEFIL